MVMTRLLLAFVVVGSFLVAGCAKPNDNTPSLACTIRVSDLPARIVAGSEFQFDSNPTCTGTWMSDHVGAHYGPSSAEAPTTNGNLGAYTSGCIHHSETPTTPAATKCTIAQAGTYYLRGHARIMVGDVLTDFWSREYLVVAVSPDDQPLPGAPQVLLYDVPSTVAAGTTFTMPLEVEWAVPEGTQSNHVGAHYDSVPHPNPTGAYANGCSHSGGAIPGDFTTTCTLPVAGTQYLRGHARFENGGALTDYWSDEVTIVVT
jgi:hypothetical protein